MCVTPSAHAGRIPVLPAVYLYKLVPLLGMMLLKRIGPKRARALKDGRSGYDISSVIGGGATGAAAKEE